MTPRAGTEDGHGGRSAILRRLRFFNTAGPVRAADHYLIPPLDRLDFDHVQRLIRHKRYFVLHAPRQTGKTSVLDRLCHELNAGDRYRAVYLNVEGAQAAREDVGAAIQAILSALARAARRTLNDDFVKRRWRAALDECGPHDALQEVLSAWAGAHPKPLVLLLDEVDSLVGDALISVLRQLRAGYLDRPKWFPSSVVLCGVRDVRDYRIHSSSEKAVITGGSAFNIKAESFRLGDFREEEVRTLLTQHTEETGQRFTDGALAAVWEQTRGQPWLVNALAYQACFADLRGQDRRRPVTRDAILRAREALILRRDTHLDQLADKLQEPRVRRVVEPVLTGANAGGVPPADLEYVRDLGLVTTARGQIEVANPIYAEVIPRELTWATQVSIALKPAWYVREDGSLDVGGLLGGFQQFFRENAEHWIARFDYLEAGPQLLLQAYLQRVVNSGGRIERENGLGRGRVDLVVVWPGNGLEEKTVIECKVVRGSLERTIEDGVRQTREYMDRAGTKAGHLVVFDRRPGRSWKDRIFCRQSDPVTVWGM